MRAGLAVSLPPPPPGCSAVERVEEGLDTKRLRQLYCHRIPSRCMMAKGLCPLLTPSFY